MACNKEVRNLKLALSFTLVDKAVLWHSDEDGPKGDVEVGRVQKENIEAVKSEKLQLTSPLAIDPIGGHKEEEQAVHRNKQACERYH